MRVCEDGRVLSLALYLVSLRMGEPGAGSLWELLGSLGAATSLPPLGVLTASPQSRALSVPFKITLDWDFPGAPVVKTSPSNARGVGSIPNWGAKTPHALQPTNQNMKQKPYCNKLIKTLRMVHIKKKKKNFFFF